MAIDFETLIPAAERVAIVEQRVKAWAMDAFSHQLNKDAILAADPGADTKEQDDALAVLETAISGAVAAPLVVNARAEVELKATQLDDIR